MRPEAFDRVRGASALWNLSGGIVAAARGEQSAILGPSQCCSRAAVLGVACAGKVWYPDMRDLRRCILQRAWFDQASEDRNV